MFKKLLKMALLTLVTYLFQATVPKLIAIRDVAPNLALPVMAIVSIAMGVKYTVFMSFFIGYFLEITLPAVNYLNLILYPVCAILSAISFADRSERKLSEEHAAGLYRPQWNPKLRTILCAIMSIVIFETVHLMYTYLSGFTLDLYRVWRAVLSVLYTAAITALLQYPLRRLLGVHKLKQARG